MALAIKGVSVEELNKNMFNSTLPLPDVWIPLVDNLDMITGTNYGKKPVQSGQDVVLVPTDKIVSFTRSTTATYVDKMGLPRVAAINAPRIEKGGLLIEGYGTNLVKNPRPPTVTGVLSEGPQYGDFKSSRMTYTYVDTKTSINLYSNTDPFAALVDHTAVIHFKVNVLNGVDHGIRIRLFNVDSTFMGDCAYSLNTQKFTSGAGVGLISAICEDSPIVGFKKLTFVYTTPSAGGFMHFNYIGGNGSSEVEFIHPQIELGRIPTSFYDSSGAVPTRTRDAAWIQLYGNCPINAPVTIAAEFDLSGGLVLDKDGGNAAVRSICGFYTHGAGFYTWVFMRDDLKLSFAHGGEGRRATVPFQENAANGIVVARSDGTNISVFHNGVKGTVTPVLPELKHNQRSIAIGNLAGGENGDAITDRELFGHVRNFRIWHRALSDEQILRIR